MSISVVSSVCPHQHLDEAVGKTPKKEEKGRRKNIWETVSSDLTTSSGINRLVVRPIDVSCRWAKWSHPNPSKGLQGMCQLTQNTQSVLTITGFPNQVVQFVSSCQELSSPKKGKASERRKAVVKVAVEAIGLTNPARVSIRLAHELSIFKPSCSLQTALKVTGGVGSGATVVGSVLSILKEVENLKKVSEEKARAHKIALSVLKMTGALFFIVSGVLAIASLVLGFVVAPLLLLIFSTVSLVLSLGIYFYERSVNFPVPS